MHPTCVAFMQPQVSPLHAFLVQLAGIRNPLYFEVWKDDRGLLILPFGLLLQKANSNPRVNPKYIHIGAASQGSKHHIIPKTLPGTIFQLLWQFLPLSLSFLSGS